MGGGYAVSSACGRRSCGGVGEGGDVEFAGGGDVEFAGDKAGEEDG